MAEIFLAKLEGVAGFEKFVIIKKILSQWSADPHFISMLIDEAKISVQLNHPGIVQVYELGREGDTYYIVMEYVQGVDVRKLLAKCQALKKKIPQDVALYITCEILESLGYAHIKRDRQGNSLNIIHRDISPQNILVSMEGSVKLTDFGIAKAALRHQETMTGVLKGKFAYMSPEQASQFPMDHRSDLYSMAIVLYELLTQERLFYRGSDIETLDRVRRGQISFSENAEKTLPEKLKEILLKALSAPMEERYLDAYLFRDALVAYVKKAGKDLRRERLADFVKELFADELQAEILDIVNETRLAIESTASVTTAKTQEELKGESPEVLVTRVLPTEPLETSDPERIRDQSRFKALMAVLLATVFLSYFLLKDDLEPPAQTPVVADFPPPLQNKMVIPPEAVVEISEKNVLQPLTYRAAEPEPNVISASKPDQEIKTKDTKKDVAKANPKKEILKSGFLSIQALPWGLVKIDGVILHETPVIKKALSAGVHRVEVSYEPEGSRVASAVLVRENEEKKCVADFKRKERKLRCD